MGAKKQAPVVYARGWCKRCLHPLERGDCQARKIVFLVCPQCSAHCDVYSVGKDPLKGMVTARAVWSVPKHRRG